jgi:hypothetical protein
VTEKKTRARYWILGLSADGTSLASGHDEGLDVFELNQEKTSFFVASNNFIIYTHGLQHFLYNIQKKTTTSFPALCKPKEKNSICYYSRVSINQFSHEYCMFEVY